MFNTIYLASLTLFLIRFVGCKIDLPTQPPSLVHEETTAASSTDAIPNAKTYLETASIRSEIQKAIDEKKYAIGPKDESKIVAEIDKILGEEYRSNQFVYGLMGSAREILGAGLESDESENESGEDKNRSNQMFGIIPDHVHSTLGEKDSIENLFIPEYHVQQQELKSNSREVLQLNAVKEDLEFQFGEDIKVWKVFHNDKLVGLADNRIIVLTKRNNRYQITSETKFGERLETIEVLTVWNSACESMSHFFLVPLKYSLRWLNVEGFTIFWDWKIGSQVYNIQRVDDAQQLLAVLIDSQVLIYKFDIMKKSYFAVQTISIEPGIREMVYIDLGYQIIAAIPQNNSIQIFESNSHQETGIHFIRTSLISTESIVSIEGFQMGGQAYLAVGGNQPKIYRFYQGNFVAQTILDSNFGFVEFFLSIPCRNYRDDLILLVQHKIEFSSHSLTVVEPLIWNGISFELSKFVPCEMGNMSDAFGLSCMLDMNREDGLKGSAIFSDSQGIFMIVPRLEAPSGLFQFNTELVLKQTDIENLEVIFQRIQSMGINQAKALDTAFSYNSSIYRLETKELIIAEAALNKIIVNDIDSWTDSEQNVNLTDLLLGLANLSEELANIDKDLIVEEIIVNDLFVENVNHVPYMELNEIHHNGTVIFEEDLTVENLADVVQMQYRDSADDQRLEILRITGQLQFDNINGLDWKEFISNVIFKDNFNQFEQLNVSQITVDGDVLMGEINKLLFPADFLLSSGPDTSRITGKKTFSEVLNANAMDCDGNINAIDPQKIITLSNDQTIPGTTTFKQLEVSQSFEINGTISGKKLENFIENPSLLDVHHLESQCQFQHLEVNGPITIKGLFNNRTLDDVFNDVIYRTDENVRITSVKSFKDAKFHGRLRLNNRQLSNIDVDKFLTRSTDQEISIEEIEGIVLIENLILSGLYNFINVTEMAINSIRLDEDQIIDARIAFQDPELLQISKLEVAQSLNGISVDDFLTLWKPIRVKEATIMDLTVDELNLECNIEGNGLLNGVDMIEFNKNRLSMSENQTITSDIIVQRLQIERNLYVHTINEYPTENLIKLLEKPKNYSSLLESNRIDIKQMKITGNVRVNEINGKNIDQLWSDVIWLDRENTFKGGINFLEAIHLQGNLLVENNQINSRNFENYVNDLIFKTDRIKIDGTKKFTTPINVMHNSEIDLFNDIPSQRLVTKFQPLDVTGDLQIDGDVILKSLVIEGEKFGDFNIGELLDVYSYNSQEDMHYIRGKVIFKGQIYVQGLNIEGNVNSLEGPSELFKNIVYKSKSRSVNGQKVFANVVGFDRGVHFEMLNGLNIPEFFSNIVYVNEKRPVEIRNSIIFTRPVTTDNVYAGREIGTKSIMGCSLEEWIRSSLRIDRPMDIEAPIHFSSGVLDGNILHTIYLNDGSMSNIVTLKSHQNFTENVAFSTVYFHGSMVALKSVNGVNLEKEYANTLLLSGNQHVAAQTTMQTLHVLHYLETMQPVNGRDLRQVAILHDDLQFQSSLSFKRVRTEKLKTDDFISGINFNQWYNTNLRIDDGYEQTITGNWTVEEMIIANGSLTIRPPLLINNRTDLFPNIRRLQEKYSDLCSTVVNLRHQAQSRVNFVKYLEKSLEIAQKELVTAIHPIIFSDMSLLIINKGCNSTIFHWNRLKAIFEEFADLDTGSIEHVESLSDHNFITHSQYHGHGCKLQGPKIWKVDSGHIISVKSNEQSTNNYYRNNRKTRSSSSTDNNQLEALDLNTTVHNFTTRIAESILSVRHMVGESNQPPIVSASMPFGHVVRNVAKRLWSGLQQLDDVKSVVYHAKKIYHTLVPPSNDEHRDNNPEYSSSDDHHDNSGEISAGRHHSFYDKDDDHSHVSHGVQHRLHYDDDIHPDDLVGSQRTSTLSVPNVNHTNAYHALNTIDALFNIMPLGFHNFVGNILHTSDPDHVENQINDLVKLILTTAQQTNTSVSNPRRGTEHKDETVASALAILRNYANDSSTMSSEFKEADARIPSSPNDVFNHGEAIVLQIGSKGNRRNLLAVTSSTDYSSIRLYIDNIEGDIFQYIAATNPRSLVTMEIQDETLFAFVENSYIIRVMKYKGVEGFVDWSSLQSREAITQLATVSLANNDNFCRRYFLITAVATTVEFYEVLMGGVCPVNVMVSNCNGWW